MDTRLRPLGNCFLNVVSESYLFPHTETWSCPNFLFDGVGLTAVEIIFRDASGGGVLLRRQDRPEGEIGAENSSQAHVVGRRHSIPNHIPWRMRRIYASDAVGSACFQKTGSSCVFDDVTTNSALGLELGTGAEDCASRSRPNTVECRGLVDWNPRTSSLNSTARLVDVGAHAASAIEAEAKNFSEDEPIQACIAVSFGDAPNQNKDLIEGMIETEGGMNCSDVSINQLARTSADEITTLMVRNLPTHITRADLLKELEREGFADVDFCYMPCCFRDGTNRGYAFINFCSAAQASRFMLQCHRAHRFGMSSIQAGLRICAAEVQGLEANLRKWSNSRIGRIRNPNFHPFVARDDVKRPAALVVASADSEESPCCHHEELQKFQTQTKKHAKANPSGISPVSQLDCNTSSDLQPDSRSCVASSRSQLSSPEKFVARGLLPCVPFQYPNPSVFPNLLVSTSAHCGASPEHSGSRDATSFGAALLAKLSPHSK